MTLDLTKPLMIEGIGPVRLLTSEGREKAYPLVVESERGVLWKFAVDGRSYGPHSLINAPEPLVGWMVVYGDRNAFVFADEEYAHRDAVNRDGPRLFRIEIPAEGKPSIEEVK